MTALQEAWYSKHSWTVLLAPLAWLFQAGGVIRRKVLQHTHQGRPYAVPVVVIGNINVGGTGKTPFVIGLARALLSKGIKPGIVSRGYGGVARSRPLSIIADSPVVAGGDEALLMARRTNCPLVVCVDRDAAVRHLLRENGVDVILSDDGLQHYRMHRDVEIAVVDGKRGLGNRFCLPAGPLRESPRRLNTVDWIVVNGGVGEAKNGLGLPDNPACSPMSLRPVEFRNILSGEATDARHWPYGERVHAVAGIGNPRRFADTLQALGMDPQLHCFPDHHKFRAEDINFGDENWVIMTAKDAVKCEFIANDKCWFLEVEAEVPTELVEFIVNKIH
jgi:tetraacyldisaccharide 4'-kinase